MNISYGKALLQVLFLVIVAFVLKKKGEVVGLNTHCTSTGGLTLADCQTPPSCSLTPPSQWDRGRK